MLWSRKNKKDTDETIQPAKDIESFSSLAKLYFVSEQYEAAVKVYLDALKVFPDDISLLHNLGMTYLALKDQSQARQTYRKILEIDPANQQAQESLDKLINY